MADIFVSYTSSDRLKAFWIGQELKKLGHNPRIHEWEIPAGGNIPAWMEKRHHDADYVLSVVSRAYLAAPYSSWERQAAQWAAADKRPNFALPVFIEDCEAPTMLAHIKRCDLHGRSEEEARAALAGYLAPAAMPSTPVAFFGSPGPVTGQAAGIPGTTGAQAGSYYALSNIPITVPRHFLGREQDLAAIDAALKSANGRAAISALHGLRGVGKTTLAAAYAEQHRGDYRATWWIRAETESTMRADLVGLGVRLGWVAADAKEEPALAAVLERLRDEGDGVLLVYDNANSPNDIRKYLPRAGGARIIVTSNAPNWSNVAAPVEIEVWPPDIGAGYLVARTGRKAEHDAALALSEALGGLPLAHEQAAAYCERIGVSLADYRRRFEAAPGKLLDETRDASPEYHDGLTVAKTFALAIDEAAKLHPAAEPLIVYAALLAPEPIPLFLFSEARKEFSEPFASDIAGDSLDEAVAALRAFALLDRETIPDERDPSITTDCIRLHRLVRQVASALPEADSADNHRGELIGAMARAYPSGVHRDPATWPRARRLDAIAMALVAGSRDLPGESEVAAASLLGKLDAYRDGALAAYAEARKLSERALAIREKAQGPDHPDTARSLSNLAYLLRVQGDFAGARAYHERALSIREKACGPDHPQTASSFNNLGTLLQAQGDLAGARPSLERALSIREKALGPDHPDTATSLNNLGNLLQAQGDLAGAWPYYQRALAIREKAQGPDYPDTATGLNNLGALLQEQGDLAGARPYVERALTIREKSLGPDHPDTAVSLNNLGGLLRAQGDLAGARPYFERALAVFDKVLGAAHPTTKIAAGNTAIVLDALECRKEAKELREKYGIEDRGPGGKSA